MTQPHQIDREAVALRLETRAKIADHDGYPVLVCPKLLREAAEALRRPAPMEAVAWRVRSLDPLNDWIIVDHEGTAKAMADRPNLYEVQALALIATHPVQGGEG